MTLCAARIRGRMPFRIAPVSIIRVRTSLTKLPLVAVRLPAIFPTGGRCRDLIMANLGRYNVRFSTITFNSVFYGNVIRCHGDCVSTTN